MNLLKFSFFIIFIISLGTSSVVAGGISSASKDEVRINLWADPYFQHIRSFSDQIAGQFVMSRKYLNGKYVSAVEDINAKNNWSNGAWKISAGGGAIRNRFQI